MASKYNEAAKASAIHQVRIEGQSPKDVAERAGIPLSTLRGWLRVAEKPGPSVRNRVPEEVRLVLLDIADIRGKLERILRNEGFAPRFEPLSGHPLAAHSLQRPDWVAHAWLVTLPAAGARRLVMLVERSGKDVPIASIDGDVAPDRGALLDYEAVHGDAAHLADRLMRALDRLHTRLTQRAPLRDCQRHFEQLHRCCLRAFDASPSPVAILGSDGHVYTNSAYARLFEYAATESLRSVTLASLLAGADRAALTQTLAAVFAGGPELALDATLGDGRRVHVELAAFPGSSPRVQAVIRPYALTPVMVNETAVQSTALTDSNAGRASDDPDALWEERVRRALRERHLFTIVYQPIVHLGGAAEAYYEALLRLHDEHGGEYLPASFMPAAERAGLMGVVDQWVIRQAARQIKNESAGGRDVRVFVNLSRATLLNPEFCTWLERLVEHFGITPENLVFEVPEPVLLENVTACSAALDGVSALGCGVALDHFSGGEDVFSVLRGSALRYVKLDARVTRGLDEDNYNLPRLRELTQRVQAMNLKIVVGRVQDARSVALLWQSGVDYVQGYFLQQPSKALDYDFANGDYEVATSQSTF